MLWGIAFGLLNFIPVFGPTAVILAAGLVGFATGDTIMDALAPLLIFVHTISVHVASLKPVALLLASESGMPENPRKRPRLRFFHYSGRKHSLAES